MDCWSTTGQPWKKNQSEDFDEAVHLCGLDGEECEKGSRYVVIMELSSVPLSLVHFRRIKGMHTKLEKLTPGNWSNLRIKVEEPMRVK